MIRRRAAPLGVIIGSALAGITREVVSGGPGLAKAAAELRQTIAHGALVFKN